MIALLQRVSRAFVEVDGVEVASIDRGLLVLVGVARGDEATNAVRLAERVVGYRVFPDAEGRMNLNVKQVGGALLAVPQFTLAADTRKGTRASFTPAAPPETARPLFEQFVARVRAEGVHVECGRFGADMKVTLTNDGPVTFWLEA
ncbi:MAG TPA: D-aminoacyl-tRNA deacylase [Burkholderiales bacterium]